MDRNQYWFPAKRKGWGWGPPTVWQGWAVLSERYGLFTGATSFRVLNAAGPSETFHAPAS